MFQPRLHAMSLCMIFTALKLTLCELGIEHRPIVGGNLLRHTAFKDYGNPDDYPVAQWAHDCGLYIGLHEGVTEKMVVELAKKLNKLA